MTVKGWVRNTYVYTLETPKPIIILSLWKIPDATNGISEPPEPPEVPDTSADEYTWRSYELIKEEWREKFKEWLSQNIRAIEAIIVKLPNDLLMFKAKEVRDRMAFWSSEELKRLLKVVNIL